ncbi:hypothetical protein HYU50_02450 [Candidatus Woesearchaeota archaeon]|nr:hypothetical protein [Candidatus Woesearchaeota archaeon]
MTKFGVHTKTSQELCYEAALEAIQDADIQPEDINAIVISRGDSAVDGERQRLFPSVISSILQKENIPIIQVTAACSGGGAALWDAIHSGYDNVLIIGVEKLTPTPTKIVTDNLMMASERIYEQTEGLNFPAQNALIAQQYMMKYNATEDDLALVALKNHDNAFLNPKARFIEIIGSSLYADRLPAFESRDMTSWEATKLAAAEAYKRAGITPKDVNFAELHDAFTSVELMTYEDLGFAENGKGKVLIKKGITKINGELPVNASGGLKAKGHPVSATGVSQIYEIVSQMRKRAEKRQLNNVKIGLAHNVGGTGSTATVHILKNIGG